MNEQREPAVEATGLSAGYNGEPAIEELEFRLPQGAQAAVVGPNGAGKTTLFKVIAGIMSPTGGSIRVHGHRPGQHLCVTYVPQRSAVDWAFPVTVRDVVMMGRTHKIGYFRWPRNQDRTHVQRALQQVNMASMAERQIGELSGGQQQRVFLARALAQEPEIVLLDEPLSGLDVPSQSAILGVLRRMRDQGVTVMVATHDLNLAAENFEHVMLLNQRLIAFGSPKEVFTRDSLERAYGDGLHVVGQDEDVPIVVDDHVHRDR
ncbi:MAG: metal ABC transporter ATP-binding protein [Anaerolineales bacterium]|nr:metal ABC transporter ATP-binding protein [Anaerolineales bacterium]